MVLFLVFKTSYYKIIHCHLLNTQHFDRYWIYLQTLYVSRSITKVFTILISESNLHYIPYLVVVLPFHVDLVRKNGKSILKKIRPRHKNVARGRSIPEKLYGSYFFSVSAGNARCFLSAHGSASTEIWISCQLVLICN